jgi:hypothetical protein
VGATVIARDAEGIIIGIRKPQVNIFIEQEVVAKADITVREWQIVDGVPVFNITQKIRHYSID